MDATFDAAAYEAWYATPVGQLTDGLEKAAVLSLIRERPSRALDLSCGTGNYAALLAGRGWQTIGIDRSEPMLRHARRRLTADQGRLRVICADAAHLPLRPAWVDLTTLIFGLEFIDDPRAALREVHRVLAPNGILIVAVLHRSGAWTLWRRLKRRLGPSIWRQARFLSRRELQDLLVQCGFTPTNWTRAVHFVPLIRCTWLLACWEGIAARLAPCLAAVLVVQCEAR